jgi:hypothetical protein
MHSQMVSGDPAELAVTHSSTQSMPTVVVVAEPTRRTARFLLSQEAETIMDPPVAVDTTTTVRPQRPEQFKVVASTPIPAEMEALLVAIRRLVAAAVAQSMWVGLVFHSDLVLPEQQFMVLAVTVDLAVR